MGSGFYGARRIEAEIEPKPRIGAPIRILGVPGSAGWRNRRPAEPERDQTIEVKTKGGKDKIARPASGIARFNRTTLTKRHGAVKRNLSREDETLKELRSKRIRGS